MLQVQGQMMIDMFLRPLPLLLLFYIYIICHYSTYYYHSTAKWLLLLLYYYHSTDSEEGYESLEDPFPREARRRPTEEDLDKDFDLNEEVGKKP